MKIALISPYDLARFGGVQGQVFDLAKWLREAGHDAWVVGPGRAPSGTISVGKIRVLPANGAAAPISLTPGMRTRITEAVAEADVLHIHEPLMPLVSLGALRVRGVPKVGTFHADPSRFIRSLYGVGRHALRAKLRRLHVRTAVSPVAAAGARHLGPLRIVPNGLDVALYAAGRRDGRTVLFVGRDDPRKGLDSLLSAWPTVLNSVPNARLIVAGPVKRDPAAGVEFAGAVDDNAKQALLASADVLCAPNTGGESFGLVVAEGMAAGCAVVATALPAFSYVLGDAGLLVKVGDTPGLAGSVVTVLTDEARRLALQAAARERVRRFDRSAVVAEYVASYEDAVAAAG